jgi:branched-subunit amino acid aminotransferase/4-amino-4-deoxychorismate lyase
MSRIVYLNGDYLPEEDAKISIFDRSFLMADGVYEVTSVLGGKLIDFAGHSKRLERSLNELEMQKPDAFDDLLEVQGIAISPTRVRTLSRRWCCSHNPSRTSLTILSPRSASK